MKTAHNNSTQRDRLGAPAPIPFSVAGSLRNFQQFISISPQLLSSLMGKGYKIAHLSLDLRYRPALRILQTQSDTQMLN